MVFSERRLLGGMVVGPPVVEGAVGRHHPEQIFQAALEERIALHVEEHVPSVRARQPVEPAVGHQRQDLDRGVAGVAARDLQAGLVMELFEGRGGQTRGGANRGACARQLAHGPNALCSQLVALRAVDAGH